MYFHSLHLAIEPTRSSTAAIAPDVLNLNGAKMKCQLNINRVSQQVWTGKLFTA